MKQLEPLNCDDLLPSWTRTSRLNFEVPNGEVFEKQETQLLRHLVSTCVCLSWTLVHVA